MGRKRVLRNAATGENYLSSLKETGVLDWERITDPMALKDSLVCLLYSSGTTGVPKDKDPCERIVLHQTQKSPTIPGRRQGFSS
jgi:acyl-coenzyme A synthetase/AMP-(fatty) acid ligase